ncbi:MAG: hypothetical protein HN348_12200 [Proteobacteria bacterium]|nr:hypothetical protein [Pseudomonadota bacterium]
MHVRFGDGMYEVDTKAGTANKLPSPPGHSVDGLGYGDGQIVAYTQAGTFHEDIDAEKGWFEYDGRKFDVSYWDQYSMGYELCLAWKLEKGSWNEVAAGVVDQVEGTYPPFCRNMKNDPIESEIVAPSQAGGHGWMLSSDLEMDSISDEMRRFEGELRAIKVDEHTMACQVQWLEGESYGQPAFLETDEGFVPLEGLQERGSFHFSPLGEHFVACGNKGGGVYSFKTGKRLWHAEYNCPAWWIGMGTTRWGG